MLSALLVTAAVTVPLWTPRLLGTDDSSAEQTGARGDDGSLPPFVRLPVSRIGAKPEPVASSMRGTPSRVLVPRLGVDAPVVPISVNGGVLLPPGDPQMLGWWKDGAVPGARRGGALITGHTVHTGGGALDDLETLRAGDVVRVRTTKGVLRYRVSGVTVYRKSSLARDAKRVFSQTVPGRLVLITCEDWNGHSYDSNAIVFAELTA